MNIIALRTTYGFGAMQTKYIIIIIIIMVTQSESSIAEICRHWSSDPALDVFT